MKALVRLIMQGTDQETVEENRQVSRVAVRRGHHLAAVGVQDEWWRT